MATKQPGVLGQRTSGEARQTSCPCREQLGAGGGTAGHPGIPPEVTVTPRFPPQEGGPGVGLGAYRPACHPQAYQPYLGKAESRARARTLKAPTCRGAKTPWASTARGLLTDPAAQAGPLARAPRGSTRAAKFKFIFPTAAGSWLGCGSREAGKSCRYRGESRRTLLHPPLAGSALGRCLRDGAGGPGWVWAEGPAAPWGVAALRHRAARRHPGSTHRCPNPSPHPQALALPRSRGADLPGGDGGRGWRVQAAAVGSGPGLRAAGPPWVPHSSGAG